MSRMLFPQEQLGGAIVLLTGALGFLGSVCLEQLLRLTEVERVFLLVRGKKHLSAAQRVEKLLCDPLFHMLHSDAATGRRNVFNRIQVVEGDLALPQLGLSGADAQKLKNEVEIVIHCAANLELDIEIQKTLQINYCGTKQLMLLAQDMLQLHAFMFTSTYYVNHFLSRNKPVAEVVHDLPLRLPGDSRTLTHSQLVEALLAMPPSEANVQAMELMANLNFTSTYAFGKHLTEQLLNDPSSLQQGVSKVIIRPSLIAGLQGDPYPGYIVGLAGAAGFPMGYSLGFYHSINGVAFASDYILDLIPCDVVAALVITAAAAAVAETGPNASSSAKVYHAASAHSHPLMMSYSFSKMSEFWQANPPPLRLPFTTYVTYTDKRSPTLWGLQADKWITSAKVWLVTKYMAWAGKEREARALVYGFKAFCVQNSFRYNRSIVSRVDNAIELRDSIKCDEASLWPCVWDKSIGNWDTYGVTNLAGIRNLLFRIRGDCVSQVPSHFKLQQGLSDPSLVQEWANSSSSSSSNGDDGFDTVDSSSVTSFCSAVAKHGHRRDVSV